MYDRQMGVWMDVQMDRLIDGQMDRWANGQIDNKFSLDQIRVDYIYIHYIDWTRLQTGLDQIRLDRLIDRSIDRQIDRQMRFPSFL